MTDVLQIVATALDTVPSAQLITYVKAYVSREPVDEIIVGLPKTLGGEPSESMRYITPGHQPLAQGAAGSGDPLFDERFTSTLAHRAMLDAGVKKSDRRDKGAIDRMAAVIIPSTAISNYAGSDRRTGKQSRPPTGRRPLLANHPGIIKKQIYQCAYQSIFTAIRCSARQRPDKAGLS